jgi:hypothetical protein
MTRRASMQRVAAMSGARFRMVVVRLLEGAVVLLLAVTGLELWVGYRFVQEQPGGATGMLQPDAPSWTVLAEAVSFMAFRGPVSLLFAAALLLGATSVLAGPGSVAIARVLRWETAVLGMVTALFAAVHLAAGVARLVLVEPQLGGPVDSRLLESGGTGWAAAVLVLLVAFLLWWLRLGQGVDDVEAEPVAGGAGSADGDGETDTHDRTGDELTVVEQIAAAEPPDLTGVEWVSPDGATDNGYDEYFRRR